MSTYPWETRRPKWIAPPVRAGDGPIEYARRQIAWHQQAGGSLAALTLTELIDLVGLGREIWYTDRPRIRRRN